VTRSEREEQERVLASLRRDALVLARQFALPLRALDAERPQVRRRYGICFADGRIRIRLRHVKTRELLKYSSLVDTLCHELAHLRHMNHGLRFQAFYRRILDYARRTEIYRPALRGERPMAATGPMFRAPLRAIARERPRVVAPAAIPKRPLQLDLF
jgi:predicted metal-dependent hydrolase